MARRCCTAGAVVGLLHAAAGSVTFKRGNITSAPGLHLNMSIQAVSGTAPCNTTDKWGSNDCLLEWGENYTLGFASSGPGFILDAGATINIDSVIDEIIAYTSSCPICAMPGKDANCTLFTVPTSPLPIQPINVNFTLPPCPFIIPGGATLNNTVIPMPMQIWGAQYGLSVATKVAGTFTVVPAPSSPNTTTFSFSMCADRLKQQCF